MNFLSVVIIGIGGLLGTITRYLTVQAIQLKFASVFPFGTLMVNVAGSFIIGFVFGLNAKNEILEKNWKLFLTTGFCGGFTTFSAFTMENLTLIEQRFYFLSSLYILSSLVLGMIAVIIGALFGKMLSQ